MSETYEVECPSGLKGRVRALTVGDVSSLSSRQQRKGDNLGQLLRSIWEETTDSGIYVPELVPVGSKISQWERILAGDRAFMVFESRRLTFGDDFFFDVNCRNCRARIDWKLDLSELVVSGLSDEARSAVEAEGLDAVLHRTLPKSGAKVGFCLTTGVHQRQVQNAAQQGDGAMGLAALLSRLVFIDGAKGPGDRRRFVEGIHLLDLEYLKEQWEEADIYVQDTIEIECESCGGVTEVGIPVDERFFSARSIKPRQSRNSTD